MRRPLRPSAVLLLLGLLAVAGCGDEPAGAPHEGKALETSEPQGPSRLERLRLQLATSMADDGPGGEAKAREIAREILDTCDPDDLQARRLLGWTDFQADVLGRVLAPFEDPIPEAIANRHGYAFLDVVVDLNARRWLRDPAEIERAREAVAAMREHERRLTTDRLYRLGDARRANLATDPHFGAYGHVTHWRPPFLVCGLRGERLTEFDVRKIPAYPERRMVRAEFRARNERLQRPVERASRVLSQLYAEFLRRYGERHRLKPLEAPYGGRPDYEPGTRSFEDGVALTVCAFEDPKAFQEFHVRERGEPRNPADHGYYQPSTTQVVTYLPGKGTEERDRHVRTLLRLGTYQLLDWFTRQRNEWGASAVGQECFGAGLAGYLSGVRIGEDLELEFTGINRDLLDMARASQTELAKRDRAYPLRPLEDLIRITSYGDLAGWRVGDDMAALDTWLPRNGNLVRYFQQSWMFVLFLQEYDDGRYREGFERYLEAYLTRATQYGMAKQVFERCLGLEKKDWKRLDEEFSAFVEEQLLEREAR